MLRRNNWVWRQLPLFRILGPFILGIMMGEIPVFHFNSIYFLVLIFGLVLTIWLLHKIPYLTAAAIMCLYFTIGWWSKVEYNNKSAIQLSSPLKSQYLAEVIGIPETREKSIKVLVVPILSFGDSADFNFLNRSGKAIIYFKKSDAAAALLPGDTIFINASLGQIEGPSNPDEFDYASFMKQRGVYYQVYLSDVDWVLYGKGSGWENKLGLIQTYLLKELRKLSADMGEERILEALLLGYKGDLTSAQKEAFSVTGAMHVLAVSGLHVGIIYLLLQALLFSKIYGERFKWIRFIFLITGLWLYALVTGLSASVTRAVAMFSFVAFATISNRSGGVFNAILTSGLLLLTVNPSLLNDLGFQLSYLALLGIVLLQPYISKWWEPKYWLFKQLWSITSVSLAAQVATFPLGLYYFHQFPVYFLLSNIVVLPLATIILPIGILYLSISWFDVIGFYVGFLLTWFTRLMVKGIDMIKNLPLAVISEVQINLFELYCCYAIVVSCVFFMLIKKPLWAYITLFFTCFYLISDNLKWWNNYQESKLVFYKTHAGNALAYIHEGRRIVLGDTVFWKDEMAIKQTKNHWAYQSNQVTKDTLLECCYALGDYMLYAPQPGFTLASNQRIDMLWIIHPNTTINEIPVLSSDLRLIVLGASCSEEVIAFVKNKYEQSSQLITIGTHSSSIDLKKWN